MKNLKNIFLLTLISLTSFVFGQNIDFVGQSGCVPSSGPTNTISILTTKTVQTTSFSTVPGTVYTATFTASTVNTITVMLVTSTVLINNTTGPITFTFTAQSASTTLDFIVYSNTLSNLTITNTSATGINDINQSLPLTTYSNLNSIFVKNIQNIDDVKIEVFNLAGQLVFEDKVTKDKFELNVSTGIYIVRLSKDDNFVTKKVFLGE